MMNFRKSVTKSGKRTFCFHGLPWQQHKQDKCNIDKNFFERPYISTVKISFQLKLLLRSYVGRGDSLNPPWVKVWVRNTLGGRGLRKLVSGADPDRVPRVLETGEIC